jgi:hypothetical protein
MVEVERGGFMQLWYFAVEGIIMVNNSPRFGGTQDRLTKSILRSLVQVGSSLKTLLLEMECPEGFETKTFRKYTQCN